MTFFAWEQPVEQRFGRGIGEETVMTTWKAFVVALLLVLASAAGALPMEFWGAPVLEGVSTVSSETANPVM
ncbi:MAG: hypothetical protein ACE5FR_00710 [Rhodospirillales bacterium]